MLCDDSRERVLPRQRRRPNLAHSLAVNGIAKDSSGMIANLSKQSECDGLEGELLLEPRERPVRDLHTSARLGSRGLASVMRALISSPKRA